MFLRTPIRPFVVVFLAFCLAVVSSHDSIAGEENRGEHSQSSEKLELQTRQREWSKDRHVRVLEKTVAWDPRQTALILCDMWDTNTCRSAVELSKEMVPRMNQVMRRARELGVLVIHAPSGVMDFYAGTPQRALAEQAPAADNYPPAMDHWCSVVDGRDSHYPIDVNGCNCTPRCQLDGRVTRQLEALEIGDNDVISDSGREIWNLFEQRDIDNVLMMGVHANMCVLGRPFGIRNLVTAGKNVVLIRDLTDSIYNPDCRPYVSHFTGTELIVEHIERNWCATVTSTPFTERSPFRFANDTRPHIVMVIAEDEYEADRTLPALAQDYLGKDFKVTLVSGNPDDRNDIPGIGALEDADLAIVFIRRRLLPPDQLAHLRKYVDAGKPLLAIRPTSHGFCQSDGHVPEGKADWPHFDRDILGCQYEGGFDNVDPNGPGTHVWTVHDARQHPVLKGLPTEPLRVGCSLYKSEVRSKTATILMMGRVEDQQPEQPVAWTNVSPAGGRVFYTSLGHAKDFEVPAVRRLFVGAVYWLLDREVPEFD